ncbi:hypothetical protein FIBSPDRAFT_891135 [Athelia psychrophila]|uniref:C2 domain-containing protein n=1 Tax=Athelia psychrophila TaxID=1759441 RepID=A0A166K1M5_9AGAM|nr:hypothetical protein FIBSPDRAFT_891135 [Fibularhizoctonia sp. CBS 109695]
MISASSIDVREVEDLQQESTDTKKQHYVIMKIDGKEVFKSAQVPCVPTPQWKAKQAIFTPTSDINFILYRSRFFKRRKPVQVAACSAKGIDFLDTEGVEQQLVDESRKLCLTVKFDLVLESHVEFMKAVKEDVSQLVEFKGTEHTTRLLT